MRDGEPIGVIALARRRVGPFNAREIELVETFADQAVIAIENVRLFEEVQARTRDLQESLEYQTATSEILTVISRSPTDAKPVFEIIGERAEKLCNAEVSLLQWSKGTYSTRFGSRCERGRRRGSAEGVSDAPEQ